MAQLKLGAIRDFETAEVTVHLVQRGQFNELAQECEKEYMVHIVPFESITENNGDLVRDCTFHTQFHYDTWEEAQAKYLELAEQYGAELKVQEWNLNDWRN